jgi:hypothetical protein
MGANFLLLGCSGLEPEQQSVVAVQEEVVSEGSPTVPPTPSETATEESVQLVADPTSMPVLATETVAPAATATNADIETELSGIANADVIFVSARLVGTDTWTFAVTVQHPDTGWEDYADGWDVVLPDGSVSKPDPDGPFTRLLLHPHESEQPFTRSQGNIKITEDIKLVMVRAHDLVDGFGGRAIVVDLTVESSQDFEVLR